MIFSKVQLKKKNILQSKVTNQHFTVEGYISRNDV